MLAHWKASTTLNRYRGANRFFQYLVEAGEPRESPMVRMKPPRFEEMEVPVVPEDELRRLLKACEGRAFRDRRDAALVRGFIDTGLRVSEMASIKLVPQFDGDSYVDLDGGVFWVVGKGRRQRRVGLGNRTRKALDAYLFARARHPQSAHAELWLGERGPVRASGLYQIVERRCEIAGIPRVHPHQLRHTWAHILQRQGINDADHMYLAGRRSRTMLTRYGASAVSERALAAQRRLSPGDRLDL